MVGGILDAWNDGIVYGRPAKDGCWEKMFGCERWGRAMRMTEEDMDIVGVQTPREYLRAC